ncbi:BOS complex subunit NOMO1-like [Ahaetulla prasina]|uniref:BOS complex subunit NOMO1-like n=1 Tax=Ahaetulla prasina TaxID=499056 RepID=UPI00264A2DC8|nr:BOS complex subunit NOMO1-like [Ahaetulla prasina]
MLRRWWSPAWGCWWWALCGALWGGAGGSEDIVVGCGGFVRSDVEINYSLIEIKLYTKHGTLKYQTDCAPNNGYFMIPLYDKGDFVLKIEPPLGWSFEPTSVDIHVDGVNDICTKGGDINFVFTGFSVNGKVLSKGESLGPAGVLVVLRNPSTGVTLQSTTTQPGGKYAFLKVLPGEYEVFASHPTWTLKEATTTVRVTSSNAYASSPLIVAGYNVSGSVRSDGEPMKGVMFLLFSSSVAKEDIMGCNSSPVDGFPARDDSLAYLCNVISKEDGTFTFQSLPSGKYAVIPFYRGERITFDVAPSKLDFVVEHDSLKIEPVFHVMGFSVTGRILNSPEGEGVPDAIVILNSQIKVTTRSDGSFRLENITTGTYTIQAHKEHLFFDTITVKIAPNTPQLADIIVTEFSVCGQISVTRFPDSIKQITKYKVNLWPQDKEKAVLMTTETDARGGFCFKARPGLYVLQVIVPDTEARAGLALKPKVFPVTVASKPVLDVIFSQFLASVSGKITCLDGCGELMVILQSILRPGEKRSLQLTAKSTSLVFTFENVLPGKYKSKNLACLRIFLAQWPKDVMVTIRSSIDSEPDLVLGPLKSQQELRQEQQRAEIETRRQEREKKGLDEEGSKPPVQEVVEELLGPFHYDFSYWARSGEKITVTPSSKELLFYPPSIETVVSGESCPGKLIEIYGKAGLFLEGQIHPELEGVEIVISEKGAPSPLITVFTDDKGSYSVGPLHSDLEYTVTAQKEGFILSAVEETVGDFKAFALAGVTFEIKSEDGHPLAGVLLSLSGGTFRSNLLTQDNGMLTFANLSPGQYYFKPMMKEFRFEPSSQMIEVQEGQNLKIAIIGYRTAYSCYGTVSSLNGEPEQGIAVEAVGQGECAIYGEDTVTDEEGRFRLRGLLPSCLYHIQLKAEGNDHIERALPQYSAIQVGSDDVDNVNIVAFRQINQFDLSGNVITPSEYLPTLWVKLYKSENLDNPVHTVSLGQSLFFHFPPLLRDGENYMVLLDSTLSKSQYDYTLPQVSFTTIGYHKHITLVFNPTRKLPEQDIAQGSYIALPLTLLLLLAGYNHDKLIPLLLQLTSRLQGVCALGQAGADTGGLEDIKRQAKKQKTRRT